VGTYSADQIDWLRPPEVEGGKGKWDSRWLLTTRRRPTNARSVSSDLHSDILEVALTDLGCGELRLELRTATHPLDPEGYPAVDIVLRSIDAELELLEINGAARDRWRPFR